MPKVDRNVPNSAQDDAHHGCAEPAKLEPKEPRGCRVCRQQDYTEISASKLLSAPEGMACAACGAVRDAVAVIEPALRRDVEQSGLDRVWPGARVRIRYPPSFGFTVYLIYRLGEGDGLDLCIQLDVFVEAGTPVHPAFQALEQSSTVPELLEIPWAVRVAKKWIENCDRYHPQCSVPNHPQLPTRVLDLGSPGRVDSIRLKLSGGQRGQYIALSYCWGLKATQGKTLTTTAITLANHLKGIPWNTIPLTFRDAIQFCWGLGIRYLWIDALCILQDDEADWEEQAALMAQVYENSFLTVAATACPDNESGLFVARKTQFQACPLSIRPHSAWTRQGQTRVRVLVRPKLHVAHERFINGDNAKAHALDSPLLTRAWSFQERLLPRRVIHFHQEELVWECRVGMGCECGLLSRPPFAESFVASGYASECPEMGGPAYQGHDDNGQQLPPGPVLGLEPSLSWLKSSLTWAVSRADADLSAENRAHLTRIWLDLVSEYMQLDLSYEKDRMPAIAGLAASFARPELGRYLAGVWESALPEGLLFKVEHPEPVDGSGRHTPPRPLPTDPERAGMPTWSWPSIALQDGAIVTYSDILIDHGIFPYGAFASRDFCLVDARLDLLTSNPFSWTRSCRLTVRGLLGECRELISRLKEGRTNDLNATFFDDQRFELDDANGHGSSRICCLHIGVADRQPKPGACYGFVLQQVPGEGDGTDTYRRLGLLKYREHIRFIHLSTCRANTTGMRHSFVFLTCRNGAYYLWICLCYF